MYNTTTRLTFISLLLMVMGMYNPRGKWVWNSHIYTVSWSYLVVCICSREYDQIRPGSSVYMTIPYPLPPGVVHTHRHEKEGEWNSHIYTASWSYLIVCSNTCIIQQLDWRLSPSSSWWWVCTTLGGSGHGIVIYTLFPGLIWSYARRAYDQIRPGNSVYMTIPCPLPTRDVQVGME
jgi:hypothetical protein